MYGKDQESVAQQQIKFVCLPALKTSLDVSVAAGKSAHKLTFWRGKRDLPGFAVTLLRPVYKSAGLTTAMGPQLLRSCGSIIFLPVHCRHVQDCFEGKSNCPVRAKC